MTDQADVVIVGAGIVGLAHALAAARLGLSVVVVDRDAQANGASIRNFGFVTVTGQQAGECWRRAVRSRNVWAEVAPAAGIEITQRGLVVAARLAEGQAVLEAFAETEMGEHCRLLTPAVAQRHVPGLRAVHLKAALFSPHELRVESREAIPRLATWLGREYGVRFLRGVQVTAVDVPTVETSIGPLRAKAVIVCPGDDWLSLYPESLGRYRLQRCLLQMMRLESSDSVRASAAVMSDLGLVRYLGYAELAPAQALRQVLERDEPQMLANGVHLIAVQSADGSLVVGDSHHYAQTPEPFARAEVDALILREFGRILDSAGWRVSERWVGTYASAPDRLMLIDRPAERVRVVMVTSGTGASTAFAIAEEVMAELA